MIISKENYKNQKQIILEHIKQYGNISTLEGYNKYKIIQHTTAVWLYSGFQC